MKLDVIATTLLTTILIQLLEGEKEITSYVLFPKQGKKFLFDTVKVTKEDDTNYSQKWEIEVGDTQGGLTTFRYSFLSDGINGLTPGGIVELESYHLMTYKNI